MVAWLIYVPMAILIAPLVSLIFRTAAGFLYFLTHSSLAQLAIRIPLLRFDWPAMPLVAQAAVAFTMLAWGPFSVGRFVARGRPGRELLAGLVAAGMWPLMVAALPLLGRPARVGSWAIPVIFASVIAGALAERRRPASVAPVTPASTE